MSPSASVTMLTPAKVRRLKSPAVQGVAHQRLEARAQKRGAGHRVVRVLLADRPALPL